MTSAMVLAVGFFSITPDKILFFSNPSLCLCGHLCLLDAAPFGFSFLVSLHAYFGLSLSFSLAYFSILALA